MVCQAVARSLESLHLHRLFLLYFPLLHHSLRGRSPKAHHSLDRCFNGGLDRFLHLQRYGNRCDKLPWFWRYYDRFARQISWLYWYSVFKESLKIHEDMAVWHNNEAEPELWVNRLLNNNAACMQWSSHLCIEHYLTSVNMYLTQ